MLVFPIVKALHQAFGLKTGYLESKIFYFLVSYLKTLRLKRTEIRTFLLFNTRLKLFISH